MKKAAHSVLLLISLAGAFLAGSRHNRTVAANPSHKEGRKLLYYVDPMHPAYKSDKPGIAPDCGMQLEAVYAGGGPASSVAGNSPGSQPPGAVAINPEEQQRIGVRVSAVEKVSATHTLRLFGRVAPDETRIYRLNAGLDGFIREISAVTTGSQVKKDQWLATFSAPEIRSPLQAYLLALDLFDRQKQAGNKETPAPLAFANQGVQLAADRLLNLGMSAGQTEEIRRTRQLPATIRIVAPADGFVLARNISPGQRFEKGMEWYRIADLRRVWILADAFPQDSRYIRPGQSARVRLPGENAVRSARVSEVLPQFDANTRTLKVRLEMANPGYALRPDMFVDVEFPVALAPTLAVPADAVLDSGVTTSVFVDRGDGIFESRPVETGWRFDGRVQIVKGLAPGERIVTSGNFLLDSESRMKQAMQQAKDPACGMRVEADKARYISEYAGKRYYFCSSQCKRDFDKDPGRHRPEARMPVPDS